LQSCLKDMKVFLSAFFAVPFEGRDFISHTSFLLCYWLFVSFL
jgi:hypothetical protein